MELRRRIKRPLGELPLASTWPREMFVLSRRVW